MLSWGTLFKGIRISIAQTSMSQHLNKLKTEGLVDFRRDHRTLYYSICNPDVMKIMNALFDVYCKDFLDCPNA